MIDSGFIPDHCFIHVFLGSFEKEYTLHIYTLKGT